MESIIIDKDISVPTRSDARTGDFMQAVEAALKQMAAGDSFKFTDDTANLNRHRAARYKAKRLGIKVTVHRIGEGEYRLWRTE